HSHRIVGRRLWAASFNENLVLQAIGQDVHTRFVLVLGEERFAFLLVLLTQLLALLLAPGSELALEGGQQFAILLLRNDGFAAVHGVAKSFGVLIDIDVIGFKSVPLPGGACIEAHAVAGLVLFIADRWL